jgi:hypothetical protein
MDLILPPAKSRGYAEPLLPNFSRVGTKPTMRKSVLTAILIALPLLSGCAWSDVFYNLFGDAYSAGGTTDTTRRDDYDRRVEESKQTPLYSSGTTNPLKSLPNDSWSPF